MADFPDKLDMMWFFESEPFEVTPSEGVSYYRYTDGDMSIEFSYSEIEYSVRILLKRDGGELLQFFQENLEEMKVVKTITGALLICKFDIQGLISCFDIQLQPSIHITWRGLEGRSN